MEQPNAGPHSAVPAKRTASSVVAHSRNPGMHSNGAQCDRLSTNTRLGKDQVLRNAPSKLLARHSAELPSSVRRAECLASAMASSVALHHAPRSSAPANNKTPIQR